MTEAELLDAVMKLAADRGVLALHVPDDLARLMGPAWSGFPDLMLVGERAVVFAELKADGRAGQLRPAQRRFRDRLVMAGQIWMAWDPRDLWNGQVEGVLDALAYSGGSTIPSTTV